MQLLEDRSFRHRVRQAKFAALAAGGSSRLNGVICDYYVAYLSRNENDYCVPHLTDQYSGEVADWNCASLSFYTVLLLVVTALLALLLPHEGLIAQVNKGVLADL